MSDIYDYAYVQRMQQLQGVDMNTSLSKEVCRKQNIVNTADFTPADFELLVDSIETIARLKKAKKEKRLSLEAQIHEESFENSKKAIVTCLDTSFYCTSCNGYDITSSCNNNGKSSDLSEISDNSEPEYFESDGTLYVNNPINKNTLKSLKSESEESGVFLNNSLSSNYYDLIDIDPVRKRSKFISWPKSKSLKSRLSSLLMKKRHLKKKPAIFDEKLDNNLDKPISAVVTAEEEEEELYDEVYDHILNDAFLVSTAPGRTRSHIFKSKPNHASAEDSSFVKALNLMTL